MQRARKHSPLGVIFSVCWYFHFGHMSVGHDWKAFDVHHSDGLCVCFFGICCILASIKRSVCTSRRVKAAEGSRRRFVAILPFRCEGMARSGRSRCNTRLPVSTTSRSFRPAPSDRWNRSAQGSRYHRTAGRNSCLSWAIPWKSPPRVDGCK